MIMAKKILVKYWNGTLQLEGVTTTYRGALRIASRNRNKFPPRFFDESGRELHDTGYGLAYPKPDSAGIAAVDIAAYVAWAANAAHNSV